MRRDSCRHYGEVSDWCQAKNIASPEAACVGCDMYEPRGTGLGDLVEKVIDTVTLGKVKKKPDCGCAKRRAKLNRL